MGRKNTDITIINVPMDLSIFGHKEGTGLAPKKLFELGLPEIINKGGYKITKTTTLKNPKVTVPNDITFKYGEEILKVCSELKTEVKKAVDNNSLPLVIGGDHSISIGSIQGILETKKNVSVIWIDAHPDLNTPKTTTSGNLHGMALAGNLGAIDNEISKKYFGNNLLNKENLVLFGLRNIDKAEQEYIDKNSLKVIDIWDVEKDGIDRCLQKAINLLPKNLDHLHISLDIDVVDEIWSPGVGISTKGGLTYREILYAAKFFEKIGIDSMDLVELNPVNDDNDKTSVLVIELISAFLGISYGPYERFREARGPLK